MGVQQTVTFPDRDVPAWPAVLSLVAPLGLPVQMRMIDGQLAFPDETPPESWGELRVSVGGGMVTLRREPGRVTAIIWGNADPGLQQACNALVWAFAQAGNGLVQSPSGPLGAAAYLAANDLPPFPS
jgi:hypothetical protein